MMPGIRSVMSFSLLFPVRVARRLTVTQQRACCMVLVGVVILLLSLPVPVYVAAQQSSPPAPPQPPIHTLAVFPAHLTNRAYLYTETITSALHSAVSEERAVRLVFPSLQDDQEAVHGLIKKQKIWYRKRLFFRTEPNVDVIAEIARKAGIDAVLLCSAEVVFNAKDYMEIYLLDVRKKKLYVAEGETKDFSRGEGFLKIHSLAQQVLAEYRKEQPTVASAVRWTMSLPQHSSNTGGL